MASSQQPSLRLTVDQLDILFRKGKLGPWSAASTPNLKIVTNEPSLLVVTIPVTLSLSNSAGNLHGGAIATMIDVLTTAALLVADPRPSVTVDLHLMCVSAAPIGTTVTIESRVEHIGRSMVFASCRIYAPNGQGGKERALVANGSHTKKVVGSKLEDEELESWVGRMAKL